MKNFKYLFLLAFIAILSVMIYSCSKDPHDKIKHEFGNRTTCVQEINYVTKVHTFAVFEVPDNQLTNTETMLKLPKSEYFEYSVCKKSDGTLRSEIKAKPELALNPNYGENTLGLPEALKWRTINDNGIVTIYDETDTQIDSYQSTNTNQTIADLNKVSGTQLMDNSDYQKYVDILRQNMTVHDFSPTVIVITDIVDGKKYETYIENQYQKPVMYIEYDSMNQIVSKRSCIFSISNGTVRMTNEVFETYKKSMDSDKNMKIVVLTEYIY